MWPTCNEKNWNLSAGYPHLTGGTLTNQPVREYQDQQHWSCLFLFAYFQAWCVPSYARGWTKNVSQCNPSLPRPSSMFAESFGIRIHYISPQSQTKPDSKQAPWMQSKDIRPCLVMKIELCIPFPARLRPSIWGKSERPRVSKSDAKNGSICGTHSPPALT